MSAPRVVSVVAESPAAIAGVQVNDELLAVDGRVPRDVIQYRLLVDGPDPELELRRGHETVAVQLRKEAGAVPGIEVSSAVFDRIRTCDNHCEFCFIYQLPKGMRRSLYLKDDDYRLSFLYGNFTTLTRFTELDLERVLSERLSPLFVSIHSTDPALRSRMLRNPRGATSLRWLRALLDGGIEVHGQVVVCPGVNDGDALDATLAGVLDQYPDLATVACVPLGVSGHSHEAAMRPHTPDEAAAVVDLVEQWQQLCTTALGRRLVYAADEYYLLAGRPFPATEAYDGFPQHENGIGMARAFEAAFHGDQSAAHGAHRGFFAWVDGAPAAGYRARRAAVSPPRHAPASVAILTGEYGAAVLGPLLNTRRDAAGGGAFPEVRLLPVPNDFFGGNIAVTGLMAGVDISRVLTDQPDGDRYLLPDVCLSEGRFLDGLTLGDLPRAVEVVASDGYSLRQALDAGSGAAPGARANAGSGGAACNRRCACGGVDASVPMSASMSDAPSSGAGAHDPAARPAGQALVVIAGRPNVGKSTLVNRIVGRRATVVEEHPGVTRDRVELDAEWNGRPFTVVDTGGWLDRGDALDAKVTGQAARAIAAADLVLHVVDTAVGITGEDEDVARVLVRTGRPVLLVANKVDNERRESEAWTFLSLGLGDPWMVSALHGRGTGDLLDEIVRRLPDAPTADDAKSDAELPASPEADATRVAIVGRPNVGKSTLFNRMLGEERSVVHDLPGTTRDAVDTILETPDGPIRFIDTAGMRRRSRTEDGTEYYALVRALAALDKADVVLLVIDATEGVTHQDQRLAERIGASGSPVVVVLNKWERVSTENRGTVTDDVEDRLAFLGEAPITKVSAQSGLGVHKILPAVRLAIEAYHQRVPTGELNRAIRSIQAAHAAPGSRIRYAVQGAIDPPTFTLFASHRLPATYLRYVERKLREQFGIGPTPVKIRVRIGS